MSSSLLVQMIADHVPETYLPSGYTKSEYTFPFLSVSKTPTGELPVVMVQAKAMYHHLLDAIHGLVFDVDAMGYSSVKKTQPHDIYMLDFSGHIELPRHNALLTVFMWEQHQVVNYFADLVSGLVMQYQDEMIFDLLSQSPELLGSQEQSMFKNYLNLRKSNPKSRLLINSITESNEHDHSLSKVINLAAIALHDVAVSQLTVYLKHQHYDLAVNLLNESKVYTRVDTEGFEELVKSIKHHPNLVLSD